MNSRFFITAKLILVFTLFGGTQNAWAQDEIGTGITSDLDGRTIAWEYTGGRNYEIRFEDGELTYHRTNGEVAREWRSMVPYNARKVGEGRYLVGWHETDLQNHVTLLFHFDEERLFSSALLGDYDMVHFQEGHITSMSGH